MKQINDSKRKGNAQVVARLIASQVRRKKPIIVVLCGPSHAGKTGFAKRLHKCFKVISSDQIRVELTSCFEQSGSELRVWKVFEAMKRQALKQGDSIILDACHISEQARWHSLQGADGRHTKICIIFDFPWRAIKQRWVRERRVPLKKVRRMWEDFQRRKPTIEELKQLGFDGVYHVTGSFEGSERPGSQEHSRGVPVTGRDCRCNSRRNLFLSIFHYLLAGLPIRPGGQWYDNREVNYG